ncbi:MAG: hypothetical protein IPP36_10995 [Nitrosomonadales bacterium]|nr:hypothetical protein [Nitrosomonadales bacterium]
MGIVIMLMLAWALYSAIRAVVVFIKPLMRAKPATRTPAASMPNEPNWAELETPTFIRLGLAFPVLTEKKKRVRKKIQVAA